MMQQHGSLRGSHRSSVVAYSNTRSSCSTLNAASRTILVTRAQQQQPRQSLSKFTSAEKQWRWFGFHATACSQQATPQTEYISLAVYDLDSGDFYSTLINPKLHNPGYRFTSARLKGLTKQRVEAEGVHMMEAFHQMVCFVDSKTEPGQTAAVVAHRGFSQQFKQVEQCLDSVAATAAADMKAHQQPVVAVQDHESGASSSDARSTSSENNSTVSSTSSNGSSESSSSSSSTRRRRKVHTTVLSSNSTSRLTAVRAAKPDAVVNSTVTPHTGWPSHWKYHDTHIMARFVQLLMPPRSTLGKLLDGEPKLEALDEALLPQPTHKLTAQPCHAAYQAAKSTALLSQVLLQLAAQKPVLMDEQQGSSSSVDEDLLESKHIQDRYSALVCQPYALTCNESERYQELLPPWERLKRPAPRQRFKWLEELPPDMSSEKEEFLRRDCPRSNV